MDRYTILRNETPVDEIETPAERHARRQQEREERRRQADERNRIAAEAQDKLTAAFKTLRKQGFIARQRHLCCNSCAGCKIADDVETKVKAGKLRPDFKGAVFYSRQSGIFRDDRISKLYLQFGQVSTDHGDKGIPTVEAGKLICQTLREAGLTVEWDGTEHSCILVDPIPGLWPEGCGFSCYG